MYKKKAISLLMSAVFILTTPVNVLAETINVNDNIGLGSADTSFSVSADILGGGLVVTIPDEITLEYNQDNEVFEKTTQVNAKGFVEVNKYLEVSVPTDIVYTLDKLDKITADGKVTFGVSDDDNQLTTWSQAELKTKDTDNNLVGINKDIYVAVPKENIVDIGTYKSVINFNIELCVDKSELFSWSTTNTEATVLGFADGVALNNLVLPSTYKELPVVSIGSNAFKNNQDITNVKIPDSIKTIGEHAFSMCSNLVSVKMADGITDIGGSAFWFCENLTSVEIPDSVTSIGWGAFGMCSKLSNIKLSDSLNNIDIFAFEKCSSLTSIELPNSITYIGEHSFDDCSKLASITYRGIEYTSVTDLKSALQANGVVVESNNFYGTALTQ